MAAILHYGHNGLLLTTVCVKTAACSQSKKDELEINLTFRSFRMEIQCEKYYKSHSNVFKMATPFQDHSHVLFLNIAFII